MSAYDDFTKEKQDIDELLFKGYSITGIREDLDGAEVSLTLPAPGKGGVQLQLLTADARKYVTTLVFAGRRAREAQLP